MTEEPLREHIEHKETINLIDEELQTIAKFMQEHSLEELEIKDPTKRIRLKSTPEAIEPIPIYVRKEPQERIEEKKEEQIKEKIEEETEEAKYEKITSPLRGTFYRSPSPEVPSYVEEEKTVKKGEVMCLIESMKTFNEIKAEFDLRVKKILVQDASLVEAGQTLFLVEKL